MTHKSIHSPPASPLSLRSPTSLLSQVTKHKHTLISKHLQSQKTNRQAVT